MRFSTSAAVISAVLSQVSAQDISVFTLKAWNPQSTLQGKDVNAAGRAFYVGLDSPATYCPLTPSVSCPPGNETVVYKGGMSLA
jgi:hypothetical protein